MLLVLSECACICGVLLSLTYEQTNSAAQDAHCHSKRDLMRLEIMKILRLSSVALCTWTTIIPAHAMASTCSAFSTSFSCHGLNMLSLIDVLLNHDHVRQPRRDDCLRQVHVHV